PVSRFPRTSRTVLLLPQGAGGETRLVEVRGKRDTGTICAGDDDDKRRDRRAMRDADHATRQAEAEIDRQLADAESALAELTQATLFAAGYHKHKGQWRKKRHASN